MIPFRSERLENGLELAFFDLTNRYFGDYHRVCVEIRLRIGAQPEGAGLAETRLLERMAVAGADVLSVRDRLVEDFLKNALPYLSRSDFPARLGSSARRPLQPAPPIFRNVS